jgi:23S rRNA (pseudouridine1915-N3)-methyltransferase
MKITLLFTGKTEEGYLKEGINIYINRLKHYIPVEIKIIGGKGKKSRSSGSKRENRISTVAGNSSYITLLDEKGESFSSEKFARFIEKLIIQGYKEVVFVTGDAYGISDELYTAANKVVSLSELTFTHQMVRLILAEQLYRAMTIIKGESYHHE